MKLLTLNTHSLAEENYEQKLNRFAEMIAKERPDVFALQEVNQTIAEVPVFPDNAKENRPHPDDSSEIQKLCLKPGHYIPCRDYFGPLRRDNHALRLAALLEEKQCPYFWTWVPAKIGYKIYEEGLALFSLSPIRQTEQFFISQSQDFSNWKTRKILGIQTEGSWYYSVHMGWWKDEEEPFARHWDRLTTHIQSTKPAAETVWILGDFNSPAEVSGEGYDYVKASGWQDTYTLAEDKDSGITVGGMIDGWRNQSNEAKKEGMRIDYIWCSQKLPVRQSRVVFNGIRYPIVSDHYGVMITL